MARIERLEKGSRGRLTLHDPVDAVCYCYELDGRKLLQIDTFGRNTRKLQGKVSQSFQIDEEAAKQLFHVIGEHFGLR